jgi:hypothetical protein
MKLDKNTLIVGGIGIAIGYTICYFMNRNKTSISIGVDGKPSRMARRKVYKWNGQGKAYSHSKRTTGLWTEAYLMPNEIASFSLTGNTDNYQGSQYSETTITRNVNGALENVWVLTTSLIQIG